MPFEYLNPKDHLPHYRSHKVVQAGKIVKLDSAYPALESDIEKKHAFVSVEAPWLDADGDTASVLVFPVAPDWIMNRHAYVGGYFVVYDDGYTSFSPAEAFESGYTLLPEA